MRPTPRLVLPLLMATLSASAPAPAAVLARTPGDPTVHLAAVLAEPASAVSCAAPRRADRNRPGERGHVTCDSTVTWCASSYPAASCVASCRTFEDCLEQCGTYWFCGKGGVCLPY